MWSSEGECAHEDLPGKLSLPSPSWEEFDANMLAKIFHVDGLRLGQLNFSVFFSYLFLSGHFRCFSLSLSLPPPHFFFSFLSSSPLPLLLFLQPLLLQKKKNEKEIKLLVYNLICSFPFYFKSHSLPPSSVSFSMAFLLPRTFLSFLSLPS